MELPPCYPYIWQGTVLWGICSVQSSLRSRRVTRYFNQKNPEEKTRPPFPEDVKHYYLNTPNPQMYFRVSRNTRGDFRNHNVGHSCSALTPGYFILPETHFPAGRAEHRNLGFARVLHSQTLLSAWIAPTFWGSSCVGALLGVRAVGQGMHLPFHKQGIPRCLPPDSGHASGTC